MKSVIVVGAGAAGIMAALRAAECGARVTLVEKMRDIGRKLRITGKGRCNLTNACDREEMIAHIPGNGRFLYSAFYAFGNNDLIQKVNEWGLATKVERGGRVFPLSDRSDDVVHLFKKQLELKRVKLLLNCPVEQIAVKDGEGFSVYAGGGHGRLDADAVVVATGGSSYPQTGSSGDGFKFAAALGHTIVPLTPSLVPLDVEEEWVSNLEGLSLRNVKVTVLQGQEVLGEAFGEMLFTHFGLSGPIILSLSDTVAKVLYKKDSSVTVSINLKPALSQEQLDTRVQRDFQMQLRKQFKNSLGNLLPAKLIPVIIDLSYIDPEKPVHQVTRQERMRLVELLQNLSFTVTKTRPLAEAIVTAGGVSVKEVDPRTMASRIVPGLFFAGEVLDVNGFTGGYNLQAAFSTGYVAGEHSAL